MSAQPLSRVMLGRYVVVDPSVCHGQPTFAGSRVRVADVLEQVAMGMSRWACRGGRLSKSGVGESRVTLLVRP